MFQSKSFNSNPRLIIKIDKLTTLQHDITLQWYRHPVLQLQIITCLIRIISLTLRGLSLTLKFPLPTMLTFSHFSQGRRRSGPKSLYRPSRTMFPPKHIKNSGGVMRRFKKLKPSIGGAPYILWILPTTSGH